MRVLTVLVSLSLVLCACKSEWATCRRMKDLCGTEPAECKEMLKATRDALGEKGVDAVSTCYADAKSCVEAGGCVAGAGFKGLGEAAGDFFKGFEKGAAPK